jgi:ketosteroid isomerase-like protein
MEMTRENEVAQAAANLVAAFGRHDTEAYFRCFDPQATFVFYTSDTVLTSTAQYQELFASWERDDGFRVLSCQSHQPQITMVDSSTAIFIHHVTTILQMAGEEQTVHERETIVFHHTNGLWRAVHEHLSPQPPNGVA